MSLIWRGEVGVGAGAKVVDRENKRHVRGFGLG